MTKKKVYPNLFGLRLTPQEATALAQFAERHGKSASEIARTLMRVGAVYAKPADFGIQLDDIVGELENALQSIYDTCAGEQYGAGYDAALIAWQGLNTIATWRIGK